MTSAPGFVPGPMCVAGGDWHTPPMSTAGEILVGAVIAVGVVGVVLPVMPGSLIVAGGIAIWASETGGAAAYAVLGTAAALLVGGSLGKWLVAGRHLRTAGVPTSTVTFGGLAGIIGFFVVPVVGLLLGFLAAVYVAERVRLGQHAAARRSTAVAVRATGLAMLVELAGALLAASVWGLAVLVT